MSENFDSHERIPVPREGEVIRLMEGIIGEKPYTEVLRREDTEGQLYRLVVEVIGDDGDPVRYDYVRAGQFADSKSSQTVVDIIYLNSDGDEVGGDCAAKYVDGTWQNLKQITAVQEEEVHEDDIDNSEGMRILMARNYNLPETATYDEILEVEETESYKRMSVLLGLAEDSDYDTIRNEADKRGYTFLEVALWADHGVGLRPDKQEFEFAVLNTRLKREALLREANELNKTLGGEIKPEPNDLPIEQSPAPQVEPVLDAEKDTAVKGLSQELLNDPDFEGLGSLLELVNKYSEEDIKRVTDIIDPAEAKASPERTSMRDDISPLFKLACKLRHETKADLDKDHSQYPEFWRIFEKFEAMHRAVGVINMLQGTVRHDLNVKR